MEKMQVNNVIHYLSTKSEYVGQNNFGEMFNEYPIEEIMAELVRLNVVNWEYRSGGKVYLLQAPAKNDLKTLPREFENDPYGFWLDKEQRESEAENLHKWHNQTDARQRFEDYPTVKKQRNLAIGISIIAVIVSVVLEVCKKRC